jgi:hypothetical protein
MDKQIGEVNEMVEEMEKVIEEAMAKARRTLGGHNNIAIFYATMLINAGYRKIHEGAVVLTREEYERLLKEETLCERLGNDIDVKLKYIYELEDKVAQERKETAEKFAQALENRLDSIDTILHEDNEEEYLSANELGELIDEICEEITEGKV